MNYSQGVNHMINLCKEGAGKFSPYNGITINYPGRKEATGDYRLSLQNNITPTNSNIVQSLYDLINHGTCSFYVK